MTPIDIDDLLRETEATSFTLTPTTTEKTRDLDDDLKYLVVFQEEYEKRLNNLSEKHGTMTERRDEGRNPLSGELNGVREESVAQRGSGEKSDDEGREEEENDEEGVKMARKSLQEVCSDLSTLRTPQSEERSVRPKTKLCPRKSPDYQCSNSSGSTFGGGQQVQEKPRPRMDSYNNFTIDNLKRELTNLLDMFLQKDPQNSNDDADSSETTTTTTTTTTTSTTITALPPTPHDTSGTPLHSPAPPPTPHDTSGTPLHSPTPSLPPPPSTKSMEDLIFTYPSSPSIFSVSSFHLPSPSHHSEERKTHDFFFTLKEGVRSLSWSSNRERKKRKKRKDLVIGEPQDFRQLTSTTSIKPDADLYMRSVTGRTAVHGAG